MGNQKAYGQPLNPFGVNTEIIPTHLSSAGHPMNVLTTYQSISSSCGCFMETNTKFIAADNLSNVDNIFNLAPPTNFGNSVFNTIQTYPTIFLNFIGNVSAPDETIPIDAYIPIKYIDNGKIYNLKGVRNEERNYLGWQPVCARELYPTIARSDLEAFDYPQFSVRGTRKIPAYSGDSICGPIPYTGETYNHLNFNWFFGNNASIDFNPIKIGAIPVSVTGSTMFTQEGCASISTVEGSTVFYTNGETVYTSGNTIMLNGTGLSSSGTSTQSAIIVPVPAISSSGTSTQYYIFTTDFNGNPNGFEWSLVDMTLNGGEGMVTSKNIKLINDPVSEKVTACCHGSEDAYWVITHTSGDTSYYSYQVSSSGLSGPVVTNIGSIHNTARGYMKTSPDNSKLISLLYDEDIIDILDFNDTGGTLSNLITLTGITYDIGPYGLEFSSDSTKFYVSEGAGEKIYQFDLTHTTAEDIKDYMIELSPISGASLGALQMGPDEKIYVADLDKPYLHVIHHPNGLGVQCNLQTNDFILSGTSISGVTSQWGLPNIITCKAISCDRYIYVSNLNQLTFPFSLVINNVNDIIDSKYLDFTGEIYKYDKLVNMFTDSSVYSFNINHLDLSNSNTTQLSIPLAEIGEGEFIIKGYYGSKINTLVAKQLDYSRNSINTYKRGEEYGLYMPSTDWYFLNMYEASTPQFNNNSPSPSVSIGQLTVESTFTTAGNRRVNIVGLTSDPLVAYNGGVLAKDIEYITVMTGTTTYLELTFDPLEGQMITFAYVKAGGTNDIYADLYTVTAPIASGPTNSQSATEKMFFNTTQNKYEFYIDSPSAGDIILSINGSIQAEGIEYLRSSSNDRRLILTIPIVVGDIIEAFYTPQASVIGKIYNNKPTLSWFVSAAPTNTDGRFTVQWAADNDPEFNNILYSFQTPYIIGEKSYSIETELTNAMAGDKFLYRILNEKFYWPIVGGPVYSFIYSITVEVEIASNMGEVY
tara:strand:+ start:4630 stop:7575 length:2946 start_codon:yes stop_codon:yes gene_type:complete